MALQMYEDFLFGNCKEDIIAFMSGIQQETTNHSSIIVSLNALKKKNFILYYEFLNKSQNEIRLWDKALLCVQNKIVEQQNCFLDLNYSIKKNCHVRFVDLPFSANQLRKGTFPDNESIGNFVEIKGNVIQITQEKLLEIKREMICSKCSSTFVFEAKFEQLYKFELPEKCLNALSCSGKLWQKNKLPKPEYCIDLQEIKIQEILSDNGRNPKSMIVFLTNDLVNICKPGESVSICGTLDIRWGPLSKSLKSLHFPTLRAHSILKDSNRPNASKDFNERMMIVQAHWLESVSKEGVLQARNILIDSICPEIAGLKYVKLGLALSLCSVSSEERDKKTKRNHSHVLLVGDPGIGKSKLLISVSQLAVPAIHTNGLGSSSAGLTASAFKDGSDWNLQAGALVSADGGICCIDQINLMRQHDKAALHETMEQQTISIAKAGIVCKLQTQCAIFASANITCSARFSEKFNLSHLNIAAPLLSRFDLIFIIEDIRNADSDVNITEHLLKINAIVGRDDQLWTQQKLKSYIYVVKKINPKFSDLAYTVLGRYFQFYRAQFERDLSRTSIRMLECLHRLAQSHARLMFRTTVKCFDAITVILLLETTLGFGKIIDNTDFLDDQLPIEEIILAVMNRLNLMHLAEQILKEYNNMTQDALDNEYTNITQDALDNRKFDYSNDVIVCSNANNKTLTNSLSNDFRISSVVNKRKDTYTLENEDALKLKKFKCSKSLENSSSIQERLLKNDEKFCQKFAANEICNESETRKYSKNSCCPAEGLCSVESNWNAKNCTTTRSFAKCDKKELESLLGDLNDQDAFF